MLFWPHNTILALTGSPKITTAALHLVDYVLGLHFIRPIWEEALDEDPLLLGALNQSHSEIRGVFAETKLGSSSAVDLFKLQLHNANYEGQQTGAPPLQMSALVWLSQREKFHLTCRCMWSKIKSKTRDLTHTHTHHVRPWAMLGLHTAWPHTVCSQCKDTIMESTYQRYDWSSARCNSKHRLYTSVNIQNSLISTD